MIQPISTDKKPAGLLFILSAASSRCLNSRFMFCITSAPPPAISPRTQQASISLTERDVIKLAVNTEPAAVTADIISAALPSFFPARETISRTAITDSRAEVTVTQSA